MFSPSCPRCEAELSPGSVRCPDCDADLVASPDDSERRPVLGELKTLRTFINRIDADIARSALETAGIPAIVQSDDCGGMRPHLWLGGVKLVVRAEDEERAEKLLESAVPVDFEELSG